jgi:hypothetical protein
MQNQVVSSAIFRDAGSEELSDVYTLDVLFRQVRINDRNEKAYVE